MSWVAHTGGRARVATLLGPRCVEIIEYPLAALGSTDVLVQVTECGVCTSDVDLWSGTSDREFPVQVGHEVAGTVLETGSDVKTLGPGSRVACWVDGGGLADALIAEERHCIAVEDSCPCPVVAEPLGCIVNAVGLAAPRLGDDVVIIGAGFMGNLLQLVLGLRGARSITVADVRSDALERAKGFGATHTVDTSSEDLGGYISEFTEDRGADISFEVTGTNGGLELAEAATRMSGKLCIVGYHQGGTRQIRLGYWNWMAFSIVNAHFRDRGVILAGMRTGLRLLSAGALDPTPLLFNVFSFHHVEEAFRAAEAKTPGFVKAVVRLDTPFNRVVATT
jgi:L-iditol 2-dehydrogenase